MCYPQALGLTLLYPIYWVLSCISWKSLSCFWYWLCSEQFLQYLYLPQDCMQFTAEPRTHSPMSQILNLNWKIKMLLNSRRSLKMLVMPWLYEGSLAEAAEAHTLMSLEKNREGSQQEEQSIGQVLAEVLPFCVRAACESRSLGSVAQEVVPGPRFHGVPGN